jgi:carbon monoxide dehydrogenase subunit G
MSVTVPVHVAYEFGVHAPFAKVFALLADVPESVRHFPKVERLVDMGDGVYRWEMEPVGTPQVNIQTVYASRYVSKKGKGKGTVSWTPVPGIGNALVSGSWTIVDRKTHTELTLDIEATVHTGFPQLMHVIVEPIVREEFESLLEIYIDSLIDAFGGEVE